MPGRRGAAGVARAGPSWNRSVLGNRLLLVAVAVELGLLGVFLAVPRVAGVLGHTLPTAAGWAPAALAVPAVLLVDRVHKAATRGRAG